MKAANLPPFQTRLTNFICRRILFISLIGFTGFSIFSCQKKAVFNAMLYSGQTMEKYDGVATLGAFQPTKKYEIKNVMIDGNSLYISVNYEASCSEKEVFVLMGNEKLNEEVYPPIRQIQLSIRPTSDTCRSLRSQTLNFNIREFTWEKERDIETDLELKGWRQRIRYVYLP